MKLLDIGEVASRTGMRPSTLRYYEETGLISSVSRRGLRRQFAPEVVLQLKLITLAKSAGFALGDIAGMFGKDGLPDLSRSMLHARADALEEQIRELVVLQDMVRHMAECRAPSHMECPTFRRLLENAGPRNVPA
jgi:DNA-binding transcriptional MerR regulator